VWLAQSRKEAGDLDGAEHLWHEAADSGNTQAQLLLIEVRKQRGDRTGARQIQLWGFAEGSQLKAH
jgi:hypothetical protein